MNLMLVKSVSQDCLRGKLIKSFWLFALETIVLDQYYIFLLKKKDQYYPNTQWIETTVFHRFKTNYVFVWVRYLQKCGLKKRINLRFEKMNFNFTIKHFIGFTKCLIVNLKFIFSKRKLLLLFFLKKPHFCKYLTQTNT